MHSYVIIDLEMCHIPKRLKPHNFICNNELIQIGAVLLSDNLEIKDSFMTYVSPSFGVIDTYIEKLTGLTETNIKNAPKFDTALQNFLSWLPSNVTLVSWSNNDELQIKKEAESKNINLEDLNAHISKWIDCQENFSNKMNTTKKYKLSEALIISDIDYKDGEHDALIDAQNTALLFAKMESEPDLILSSYYCTENNITTMYHPFAQLLSNIRTN